MSDQTALERAQLTIRGDRAELVIDDGRVSISKEAPTRDAPTSVEFSVDQIRSTQIETPRGARGWLHVSVVGGSPAPPGELAAAGDPYTLPLTGGSTGAARRFSRLVDRHVRERGMPRESGPNEGRLSSGVTLTSPPPPAAPDVPAGAADPAELVAELQALADLRASGALTDDEFERAKAKILG